MGLALAKLLAAEGARVVLLARHKQKLEAALRTLPAQHGQTHSMLTADVTSWDRVKAAVRRMQEGIGVPDVLINAAGAAHPAYFQDTSLDVFREMMDLNYFGTVHMVKAVVPAMIERGSGYIVTFSSGAGFMAPFGYAAYAPSKYAVRGFSDSLRLELKPMGIRVSIVFPPDTDTPGMEQENKTKPPETLEAFSSRLLPAQKVAEDVLKGMKRGKYTILPGGEISLYYRLSNGLGAAIYPLMDHMLAQARRKKTRTPRG
jgi:3-dehydrosphinganine reductase